MNKRRDVVVFRTLHVFAWISTGAGCTAVAPSFTIGDPNSLDRKSAYWAFRQVSFSVFQLPL
jgi:hypothetical protein